jgi:hypothetical protein
MGMCGGGTPKLIYGCREESERIKIRIRDKIRD